jgi:uncharacterized protein YerC
MTNVSKLPPSSKTSQKLFREFSRLFANSGEQTITHLFLELFTESEQIMFVKRVGIILMLREDYSNYAIAKILKVSPTTVSTIQKNYLAGEYKQLVTATSKVAFDSDKFWKIFDLVLGVGLPARAGNGRWNHIFKVEN